MKRIILSLSLATLVLLTACGGSNISYNDQVVNMHTRYTSEMEKVINEANSKADAASKLKAFEGFEKLTDSCTNVLNGLKPTEEAKGFHESVVALYASVKADYIPVYKKLLAIENPDANVDAYNKLIDETNAASTKIDQLENAAMAAQREFAQKINSRLQ